MKILVATTVFFLYVVELLSTSVDRPYFYFHAEPVTYDKAVEKCMTDKRYLLEPKTVSQSIDAFLFIRERNVVGLWIGVSRREIDNDLKPWEWRLESTHKPLGNLTFWSPGQPDNQGDQKERCVQLEYIDNNGFLANWNDQNCEKKNAFICVDSSYLNCQCRV